MAPKVFVSFGLSKRNSVNPRPDYISSQKKVPSSSSSLLYLLHTLARSDSSSLTLLSFASLSNIKVFFPSRRDLNFRDEETKLFLGKAEENIENGNAQFHMQVTRLDMDDKSAVREAAAPMVQ